MNKAKPTILIFTLVYIAVILSAFLSAVQPNPDAPILGETGRYVILASQSVTTTSGTTVDGGDIGNLDQARATYITGFTQNATNPGQFLELTNGYSYSMDDVCPKISDSTFECPLHYSTPVIGAIWTNAGTMITTVRTDLTTAYNFLATDPNPASATIVCPTELGGLNLTRGVYKTASDVIIEQGNLILDAEGDANSVWVFSIDGTLTTGTVATKGNIILKNGAQAKNVFWRVAGVVAIGTNTQFNGNVFAYQQINALTGANITGRLFSVNEQVTLDANRIKLTSNETITSVLTKITLLPISKNLTINTTQQLTVDSLDQFDAHINSTILYNSSNVSVATVNTTGFVSAIALGSSIITAYNGTVNNASTINVVENVTEETVTHSSSSGSGSSSITQTSTLSTTSNGEYLLNFSKPSLLIRSIELKTTAKKEDVEVSLAQKSNLLSNFFGIPVPQFEKLYGYIQVNHPSLSNSLIQSARIQFRVSKSWVTKNNINVNQIVLSRFTSNWDNLETKMISSDLEYYYFEATSPGLSYFAIGAVKTGLVTPVNQETTPVTEAEPTVSTNTVNTQETSSPITGSIIGENKNTTSFWKLFLIVAIGITLVGMIVYFSLVYKKKSVNLK